MTATQTTHTDPEYIEVHRQTWSAPKPYHYGSAGGTDYYTAVYSRQTWPQDGSSYAGCVREQRSLYISATPQFQGHLVELSSYPAEDSPLVLAAPQTPAVVIPESARRPMDHQPKQPHRPARKPGRLHNLRQVAARVNSGQHTAAGYLADELHADADFTRRYSSPFGKAAKKAYVEQYGAEPAKTGLDVRGHRLVRVYAYTVAVLEKATANYTRTAALAGVA